jgi:spore coat polysaccharide biosynthesis protein SpsF
MKKKVLIIIQARMGSERLPGKVLKEINSSTILEIIINRMKRSIYVDEVVVATTSKNEDDAILDLCKKLGVAVYRGSENDVFSRYLQASRIYNGEVIVRVTGDNPLTDPGLMDQMIDEHTRTDSDYTYSKDIPLGLGAEIISFKALNRISKEKLTKSEKEHVTLFIKNHPKNFKIKNFQSNRDNYSKFRFTVDIPQDLLFIKEIYKKFGDFQSLKIDELIIFLEKNPEIMEINSQVEPQNYK